MHESPDASDQKKKTFLQNDIVQKYAAADIPANQFVKDQWNQMISNFFH